MKDKNKAFLRGEYYGCLISRIDGHDKLDFIDICTQRRCGDGSSDVGSLSARPPKTA